MLQGFAIASRLVTEPRPQVDFNGSWKNELGSSMSLTVDADGSVTGQYRTAVGAPGNEEEFPLLGFASGDLLSFTVNFGKYGSLTSWVGQHTDASGIETIRTLWHLAREVANAEEPEKLWGAVLAGADNFTRP